MSLNKTKVQHVQFNVLLSELLFLFYQTEFILCRKSALLKNP